MTMRSRRWWLAPAILLAAGCSPSDTGPAPMAPLETVDLAEDTNYAPDEDPRAAPRHSELAGILPSDFPQDLPLHLPASVDAFGASSSGRTVELTSSSSPTDVRASLSRAFRARGWQGEVMVGASTLRKAGRTVHLTIAAGAFGSRYTYRY